MQLPSFKILWPSLNGFIGNFGHKTQKSLKKNQFFEFIDLKAISNGHGTQIFFSYFVDKTSLEVPQKISFHISKKWLRYDCLKGHGKMENCQKRPFLAIFSQFFLLKGFQHPKIFIENTSQCKRLYKKES